VLYKLQRCLGLTQTMWGHENDLWLAQHRAIGPVERDFYAVRATLHARARNNANRGNPKLNILKGQGYTNYPPNRGNPKIKV